MVIRLSFALMLFVPTVIIARPAWAAAPRNDDFAKAQVLRGTGGTVRGTTVGATKETGEPDSSNGESVWYRVDVLAGETFVAHTCYTDSPSEQGYFDTRMIAYQTADATNTDPTFTDLLKAQEIDDWNNPGTGLFPRPGNDPVVAAECSGQSVYYSAVRFLVSESRTLWFKVEPYDDIVTKEAFELFWYRASSNSATESLSGTLTVSRANPSMCTLSVKGGGLDFWTWFKVAYGNQGTGATDGLSAPFRSDRRGVLAGQTDLARTSYDSSHTVEIGLVGIDDSTVLTLTSANVVNRCGPAA